MKYLTTYIVFLLVIIIALAGGFIFKRSIVEGHGSCRGYRGKSGTNFAYPNAYPYPYYNYEYSIPYPPINYYYPPPPSYV